MAAAIVKVLSSRDELEARLRQLLAELLVLNEHEIQGSSLLFDDLDADSIAFIELAYRLREDFGIVMPEVKSDEETLNLPIEQGIARLRDLGGEQTLFEYMESKLLECVGRSGEASSGDRAWLLRDTSAGVLARAIGCRLPDDLEETTPFGQLRLVDTFRFVTFHLLVDYLWMIRTAASAAPAGSVRA